jgi:hypothetical protein
MLAQRQPLPQVLLGKLSAHRCKTETQLLSLTLHQN